MAKRERFTRTSSAEAWRLLRLATSRFRDRTGPQVYERNQLYKWQGRPWPRAAKRAFAAGRKPSDQESKRTDQARVGACYRGAATF